MSHARMKTVFLHFSNYLPWSNVFFITAAVGKPGFCGISTFLFNEICAFENFPIKILSALQLKNVQRYFHETGYKNKLVSDNVQRTRTVTPPLLPL